jgi:hypothetical protein
LMNAGFYTKVFPDSEAILKASQVARSERAYDQ